MPTLRIILPDQLDRTYLAEWIEPDDHVLLAETGYLFHSRTHKRKLALICSAGRHFAAEIREAGHALSHRTIGDGSQTRSLTEHVVDVVKNGRVDSIAVHLPGSFSEREAVEQAAKQLDIELQIDDDPSFFSTPEEFRDYAKGRKRIVMEYFYRAQRERHDILMDGDGPAGGQWNYDQENRDAFSKNGPQEVPGGVEHDQSEITRETIAEIAGVFGENPGSLDDFALPVTPAAARQSLDDFVKNRLSGFGRWQDAMWRGERFLFHSVLSPALNLRLLSPRDAISAAVTAYRDGSAPLNSVEGFVRQILGWREFIRGVYYTQGPGYLDENYFSATAPLPESYWTGKTEMSCVSHVMTGILEHAYAHHIERLMVMGLYGLLRGVDPMEFHEWHLAMYLDAYDWVSAPNVIGMSQFADGGHVATKPYVASGKYINRMSNYCDKCRFNPDEGAGEDACPFTTLYWDFLARHENELSGNRRMHFQLANLRKKKDKDVKAMQEQAANLRKQS